MQTNLRQGINVFKQSKKFPVCNHANIYSWQVFFTSAHSHAHTHCDCFLSQSLHLSKKFHGNSSTTFCVTLFTGGQTSWHKCRTSSIETGNSGAKIRLRKLDSFNLFLHRVINKNIKHRDETGLLARRDAAVAATWRHAAFLAAGAVRVIKALRWANARLM